MNRNTDPASPATKLAWLTAGPDPDGTSLTGYLHRYPKEVPELDVLDGIVLKTTGGLRFADADQVADITDRYVVLSLPAEETGRLGRPQGPPVYRADSSEHAGGSLHDWFGRTFGRSH